MKKLLLALFLIYSTLFALNEQDISTIKDKELWDVALSHKKVIINYTIKKPDFEPAWDILEEMARIKKDSLALLNLSKKRAIAQVSMKYSIQTLNLARSLNSPRLKAIKDSLMSCFKLKKNKEILEYYAKPDEKYKFTVLKKYAEYSKYMEEWAKEAVDEISVEPDNKKRITLAQNFISHYPYSKYKPTAYHYYLYSLKADNNYSGFYNEILKLLKKKNSPEINYLIAFHTTDTSFRKLYYSGQMNDMILYQANRKLVEAKNLLNNKHNTKKYYYPASLAWNKEYFTAKINLELSKTNYYLMLFEKGLFEDDPAKKITVSIDNKFFKQGLKNLSNCKFINNDNGEIAAVNFWYAKFLKLSNDHKNQNEAAEYLINCLIISAPRNPYEKLCLAYLEEIKNKLKVKSDLLTWVRSIKNYQGPVFEDITLKSGLNNIGSARVAWGDYDNDSYDDLLLNGNLIYKNNQNMSFTNYTDSLKYTSHNNNGGLWADVNLDGYLDFMTISSANDGEKIFINKQNYFTNPSDRAGSINDSFPTEGAAWFDSDGDSFPDLYLANYEKWGEVSAYPDFFYKNNKGFLTDETIKSGFINPWYPELAGRGVAPADYDNDGQTELLVTNYRLNRNLFFKNYQGHWKDIANLNNTAGYNQSGYYGHSIGADWGDIDNDGDLDLFIANLAHPRFIDFSDISILYRNDGLKSIKIDTLNIEYTQLTDITKDSGISYDETHSDPLFFDADNDGDLDLFISSIYPNERSYLYLNQGNYKFVDVTYLAGIRSFNAWGNAYSDINHDGKLDILVASSDGIKLFMNKTINKNNYAVFKPDWIDNNPRLLDNWKWKQQVNSPVYGARVVLYLNDSVNHKIIRELQSAKGTTSQNAQFLHFGLGNSKPVKAELWFRNKLVDTVNY